MDPAPDGEMLQVPLTQTRLFPAPVPAGTLPTRLGHSPTDGIVSLRLLGVPVPTEAVGRAAPRPRELSDP